MEAFRPMLRKKQELDPEACLRLLREEKRGVLSLLGDGGYPYGLPIDHWYDDESGKIYFHCGKTGHKLDALQACDKASFCVMDEGFQKPGEWALNIQSVIVFGRIRVIEDAEIIRTVCEKLSRKFTDDEGYIQKEIRRFAAATLLLELTPEHISGKLVNES